LLSRAKTEDRRRELSEMLTVPPFPVALTYLWRAFHRLRRRKGGSGFGPSPIEWSDIDAFVRNSGLRFAPWEVEMIEALDDLLMAQMTKGE
jgi:hypothetical protein